MTRHELEVMMNDMIVYLCILRGMVEERENTEMFRVICAAQVAK